MVKIIRKTLFFYILINYSFVIYIFKISLHKKVKTSRHHKICSVKGDGLIKLLLTYKYYQYIIVLIQLTRNVMSFILFYTANVNYCTTKL